MTSWEREEELKKAAVRGDVEFLKKCVATNKPIKYYLTLFRRSQTGERLNGNIFHLAARENREEFIREAISILPLDATKQLLLQTRDGDLFTPLHMAAGIGNLEIVKLFLSVYNTNTSSPSQQKPWLVRNESGRTPCHVAINYGNEECALEIFKMDMDSLCNMPDNNGFSLLYDAIARGLNRFALEILIDNFDGSSISCTGSDGFTALHCLTSCSGDFRSFTLHSSFYF